MSLWMGNGSEFSKMTRTEAIMMLHKRGHQLTEVAPVAFEWTQVLAEGVGDTKILFL